MPMPNRASTGRFLGPYEATHITTNATTDVVTAANAAHAVQAGGVLHAIAINTKGATANTATINVDGSAVAVVDTTSTLGTIVYDIGFNQSLQVVTASGTAADLTVIWFSQA